MAQSDMNIVSRLDSYFTNFTMPWEKKKTLAEKKKAQDDAVSTVGALQHYIVQENADQSSDLNN